MIRRNLQILELTTFSSLSFSKGHVETKAVLMHGLDLLGFAYLEITQSDIDLQVELSKMVEF